jgi:hypothetical protein
MKLIDQNEYLSLREELNEFVVLCNKYKYTPSKDEFDDAIRFILLQHGGGASHLCESYEINPFNLLNHLYESYGFDSSLSIDEVDRAANPEADFDSAVGTATSVVKGAAVGALAKAVGVAILISYLFKKGKIKSLVNAELAAELDKLKGWQKLAEERKKLAELKGETTKIDWPGMAEAPAGLFSKGKEKE